MDPNEYVIQCSEDMKILLIEDDDFLARLYASFFEDEGHTVYTEPEGEQGLYRMKNMTPDVVLLDLLMPKKDGFDVLRERQKSKELSAIPVIVLTGLEQPEDEQKAMGLGANDYFRKNDVELKALMTKIRKLVS